MHPNRMCFIQRVMSCYSYFTHPETLGIAPVHLRCNWLTSLRAPTSHVLVDAKHSIPHQRHGVFALLNIAAGAKQIDEVGLGCKVMNK